MLEKFANFDVVTRSWYVACRAKDVRCRGVMSVEMLNRRIVVWRDANGIVRAADALCPHLGADLGDGEVIGGRLRCALHHWEFDGEGRCAHAPQIAPPPGRCLKMYPAVEKFGLVWVFNGPAAEFDLPDAPAGWRTWRLPRQFIKCHPHLVIGNGLDASHFEALHGLKFSREPRLVESENGLTLEIAGRPAGKWLRMLTGTRSRDVEATFRTIGGNIAWMSMKSPVTFDVLFTGLAKDGGCVTQTIMFFPRGFGVRILRALFIMYVVLADDHRILDHLRFVPAWTQRDEPLRRFAEKVEGMETW